MTDRAFMLQSSMVNFPDFKKLRNQSLEKSNSPLNVHDHLQSLSIEELKVVSQQDRLPWHTACLNVTGDLNIGTMIRTSHCLGASSVLIFGRQKIDNRSLVGSANYIQVERIKEYDDVLGSMRFTWSLLERKLVPIFVEIGGILIHDVDWKASIEAINLSGSQPCLVMGNETGGIPKDLIWACLPAIPNSFTVSIPQRGVIRSLNVATAHAIVASNMCMSMDWI